MQATGKYLLLLIGEWRVMLSALNYLAVFLYGLFIVFFLLGIKMNMQNFIAIYAYLVISLTLHGLYFNHSAQVARRSDGLTVFPIHDEKQPFHAEQIKARSISSIIRSYSSKMALGGRPNSKFMERGDEDEKENF